MDLVIDTLPRLLTGVPKTLELTILSLAIGLVLATGLAAARLYGGWLAARLAFAYVFFFRGTPFLVQIFLIYYGLGLAIAGIPGIRQTWLWSILREPYWYAILALALNTAAYSAEIIRGGILAVPHGFVEAARACGMNRGQTFWRIVVPTAVRQALPAYGNEMILMVKATSLASLITVVELTGVAKQVNAQTFRPIEVFVAAGILYLAINFGITQIIRLAERRLNRHLRGAR